MDTLYGEKINIDENDKYRRGGALRVFFAFVILAIAISSVLSASYNIKKDSIHKLFTDLTFSRIIVDVRQSIQKIEDGLQNGEDMAGFTDIDSILDEIRNCSSYTLDVFITNTKSDNYLIENEGYFDLILPINDESGSGVAYLTVRIDSDLVYYTTGYITGQEFRQTLIIGLQFLGLGLIVLLLVRPRAPGILFTVIFFTLAALSIDLVMSYINLTSLTESATVQSVNRITQILQRDINIQNTINESSVVIYEQNNRIKDIVQDIPMIYTSSVNYYLRVILTASAAYISKYSTDMLRNYTSVYSIFISLSVVAIITAVAYKKHNTEKTG